MEDSKLQKLHETLKALAPKGKVGGLGFYAKAGHRSRRSAADGMPEDKRALYSFFVRAGDGPSGHTHFADDGDKKLKKPDKKPKPVRGDQQKLRKGSASLLLRSTRSASRSDRSRLLLRALVRRACDRANDGQKDRRQPFQCGASAASGATSCRAAHDRSLCAHLPAARVARSQELTKKIQQRIEQTMASRASTDGGGLQMVSADATAEGLKPLKAGPLVKAKR